MTDGIFSETEKDRFMHLMRSLFLWGLVSKEEKEEIQLRILRRYAAENPKPSTDTEKGEEG
jgi:hypothetical protein